LTKSIIDIDIEFESFKTKEAGSWIEAKMDTKPVEYLVKPSGSLKSCSSLRLNQSSITTHKLDNSETAVPTNGCIAQIMNGLYTKLTLIYDQVHRRTFKSANDGYPASEIILGLFERATKTLQSEV
jgi:hypothetical protein